MKKADIDLVVKWAETKLTVDEQDSRWRTRVADICSSFGLVDDAIDNLKIALNLDSTYWPAYDKLASRYRDQEEFDLAIKTLTQPIQMFKDNEALLTEHQSLYYSMISVLGSCYFLQADDEKGITLYQEVLTRDPEAWPLVGQFIRALAVQEKYTEIIEYVKRLDNHRDDKFGGSRLTKMLCKLASQEESHLIFFRAAKVTGNVPLITKAYKDAIDKAQSESANQADILRGPLYHLSYSYGIALLHYDTESGNEEAVRLWEQILSDTNGKTGYWADFIRFNIGRRLCPVYLQNAKQAGLDTALAKSNVGKLAQLSTKLNYEMSFDDIDPKLTLGRYFHLLGQREEAMASLRARVKVALDLLSDDDPTNDWQGYEKLATVLTYFEDDDNALAAWSLIRDDTGSTIRSCNGGCGHVWFSPNAMFICRDCFNVQFDKKCWETLKNGTASFAACHSGHDHLYIPEWKEGDQPRAEPGMVKVGDTTLSIKEWLAGIRMTWGLANPVIYGIVTQDFHAESPYELDAKASELVTIVAESSADWFLAKPTARPGGPGLIPVSLVEVREVATGHAVADKLEAVRRAGVSTVAQLQQCGLLPFKLPKA